MKLFAQKGTEQATACGLKAASPLLCNDFTTPLEQWRLHEYQQHSMDNLHNLKGKQSSHLCCSFPRLQASLLKL
jgi:hypothetical protein